MGSEEAKMARNNMVEFVENAMWYQHVAAQWGKPAGRNPERGLRLVTNSE